MWKFSTLHFFLIISVNVGQTSFEAIAQVVKRVCSLVEEQNDQHSRNNLLSTYIQYTCTLPHPDPGPLCKQNLHMPVHVVQDFYT